MRGSRANVRLARRASLDAWSKQEVALRHRELFRRRASQELAVGAHLVGLGIDLHLRREPVVHHALLGDAAARVLDRNQRPREAEASVEAGLEAGTAHEG